MKKIHCNDEVVVIAGKDKGKRGKVLKACSDDAFIVEGVGIVKRHTRPDPAKNVQGGIVEREAPIRSCKVAIWNPETGKADRVGFVIDEDNNKRRIFKSSRKFVDAA